MLVLLDFNNPDPFLQVWFLAALKQERRRAGEKQEHMIMAASRSSAPA